MAYSQNPYTAGLAAGSSVFGENEGRKLTILESLLTHPTHSDGFVDKGDPIVANGVVGVALESAAAATDYVTVVVNDCAYNLNVVASDENGTSAVAFGDLLYISASGIINKATTGTPFGRALAAADASVSAVVIPVHVNARGVAGGDAGLKSGARETVSIWNFAAADVAKSFWIAPAAGSVIGAYETHVTVAGQAGGLQIEKCNTGEAAASGDAVLATAWDLTSTANTPVYKAAVGDGKEDFVAGDRFHLLLASGAATSLALATMTMVVEWA